MEANNLQPAPPLVIDTVIDLEPGIPWFLSREAPNRGKIRVDIENGTKVKKWYRVTIEELDQPPSGSDQPTK